MTLPTSPPNTQPPTPHPSWRPALVAAWLFSVAAWSEQPDTSANQTSEAHIATNPPLPEPPKAKTEAHSFTHHGITVEDPWHWLRDDSYPTVDDEDILAYLEAENRYFEAAMAPHESLVETLFAELRGRQQEDEASVPSKDGDWVYQWRYPEGGQYRVWSRWPAADPDSREAPTAAAQVVLDEPALAEGVEYFRLGTFAPSNGGRHLAYSTDTDGSERYRLVVRDLEAGELLPVEIENTIGTVVWTADDAAFFYTLVDENWRPWQVRLHRLGEPVAEDALVYEESDPGFFVDIGASASRRYLVIDTSDHVTSETWLVPTDDPEASPTVVVPRRKDHEYLVDHQGDRFVIRTNDQHPNTRLVTARGDNPGEEAWQSLLDGTDELYILGFAVFQDFVAVHERVAGLDQLRILERGGEARHIEFPEAAYSVDFDSNPEFETRTLRLSYTSMVTPNSVFDFHLDDDRLEQRKVRKIPSGYDKSQYVTERLFAPARDGASVPVSLVRRRDTPADGSAPLYLYGYGAYGNAMSPSFSTARLSLLDRGFLFAIAHIRGGDELGYRWYEAGKLDRRTNTFNDFVDVARDLVQRKMATAGNIAIAGGSAGGELMGAVVNQAPELWGAVAAHVPFVDVLNTMLDASLPLTPIEWPEWGNPIEDAAAFETIRAYSPYDQLQKGDYPPILVTAGLSDPRVTYWEPAKYVAKLRTLKTDDSLLLLKTNMGAGHGGKSGRYDSLREVAEEYAFILTSLGH